MGKPGSMNSTLSFPGMRCVQAMKAPNEAATEPVVGRQARGRNVDVDKGFYEARRRLFQLRDAGCRRILCAQSFVEGRFLRLDAYAVGRQAR